MQAVKNFKADSFKKLQTRVFGIIKYSAVNVQDNSIIYVILIENV